MADRKSYNSRALAGEQDYDDMQFQADMKTKGFNIPDEDLFTPKLNKTALEQARSMTPAMLAKEKNPVTGATYTPKEAQDEADMRYEKGMDKFSSLSNVDLRKLK